MPPWALQCAQCTHIVPTPGQPASRSLHGLLSPSPQGNDLFPRCSLSGDGLGRWPRHTWRWHVLQGLFSTVGLWLPLRPQQHKACVSPAPLSVCRAVSSRSPGSVSFLPGGRCLLRIRQMPARLWQSVSTSSHPGGSPCPLVEFYSVPSWCTSVARLFIGELILTVAAGAFQVIHSLPRASRHLCPDLAAGYHESAQPHAGSWALRGLAACAALAVRGNPHPQPRIPQLAPVALWPLVAT